jgi:hypothetical protein
LAIDVGAALVGAVVGGDDEDFGFWFATGDQGDPFFDEALLWAISAGSCIN